jgi:hypothetical protein
MTHFVTENPDTTNELVTIPILKIRRCPALGKFVSSWEI